MGMSAFKKIYISDEDGTTVHIDAKGSVNALATYIVDSSGTQVSTFGGGTQYTEDDAAAANPVGNAQILIRADNLVAVTGTEGDNVAARGTNKGEMYVKALDSDNYLSDIAGAVAGTEMQVDVVAALPAGTNAIGKLAANSGVDIGDVDITSIIPGTGASNLGKAEDTTHSTGDVGVMTLGVQQNSESNPTALGGDGDYVPPKFDTLGRLFVNAAIRSSGGNSIESDLNGDAVSTTVFAVINSSRNFVYNGSTWDRLRGSITQGALVETVPTDQDLSGITTYKTKYYTNAGAVTDGIIWSPAAGTRWYVTSLTINVSTAATVTLEDDLGAGDSPIWKGELAANANVTLTFPTPMFSGEDAADLLVTTSAGNVYITAVGYEA